MKFFSLLAALFFLCFAAVGVHANGSQAGPADSGRTVDQKIDHMGNKIDDIHQAIVESPLGERKWGVEIDPVTLLFGYDLAGTVSNFSLDRSAEIAFPYEIAIKDMGTTDDGRSLGKDYLFNLDAHYRYFMSGRQRGFYISGFARFQHATYHDLFSTFAYSGDSIETKTLNRAGIGFEIGSRIFSRKGFYWGWSLSTGRFLAGNNPTDGDLPDLPSLWTGDFIFDAELMKIGFAF